MNAGNDPNLDPADRAEFFASDSLMVTFVECPECGAAIAAKWTPDGVEEITGCAQHSTSPAHECCPGCKDIGKPILPCSLCGRSE